MLAVRRAVVAGAEKCAPSLDEPGQHLPTYIEIWRFSMPYSKGDRVQYRDQQDKQHTGEIRNIQSTGQDMTYTVRDLQTNQEERVTERQIEGQAQ